ncbi:MAG TPA: hypothetical protein VJM14_05225, partial [Burkholderiales bacterium]|nr:hypothetical protein [Burkholderiales bacterium]
MLAGAVWGVAQAGPVGVYHSFTGLNSPIGYLSESVAFSREQSCRQIFGWVEQAYRRSLYLRYWLQYIGIIDGTCRFKTMADGGGFTDEQWNAFLANCM